MTRAEYLTELLLGRMDWSTVCGLSIAGEMIEHYDYR